MPSCSEMKVGQIYACGECGMELQVVKECTECEGDDATCSDDPCTFQCCGKDLVLKA